MALEALEPRTLLSTLPAPSVVTGSQKFVSYDNKGNESSPTIAVDPLNSNKLVAAWVLNDPTLAPGPTVFVQAAYSDNGGASWSTFLSADLIRNPTATSAPLNFTQSIDPSVGFDHNEHVYVLENQSAGSNGALVLNAYDFSGTTPSSLVSRKAVYEWVGSDPASSPTLGVDAGVSSFTDPDSNVVTQSDATAGNVYVAWESTETSAPSSQPSSFNPNRILMVASSDGGKTFSGFIDVANNGNRMPAMLANPTMVVSQGTATIPGGQVTVGYDDFNSGKNANPPVDFLNASQVSGGVVQAFQQVPGSNNPINPGSAIVQGTTTTFSIPVTITDQRFIDSNSISHLTVTLGLVHPDVSKLSAVLIPPAGSNLSQITLFGTGNLSGANLGTTAGGVQVGTVFDDAATRAIFTGTNLTPAAPYNGHFQTTGGSLDARVRTAHPTLGAGGVNGTWTLVFTDTTTPASPPPPQFLSNVTLTFTSGLNVVSQSQIAATTVRSGGSSLGGMIASAASPTGIGPGLVLATDNTLGLYSQHQGRIYAAYVDRGTDSRNPADNTDIFLAYSDDGGRTWSQNGAPVNSDDAQTDGYSEAYGGGLVAVSGRPQFLPQVAVDQTTGTLVLSWLDTRNDAARARVSTYTTYSIDGGATFSPQVFANVPQTATDAITGNLVTLGPIPDNGGLNLDTTYGFGSHEGLAVSGGNVYPIWASNLNGDTNGKHLMGTSVASVLIPAGPRIISSTQGPVGGPNDKINSTTASDGTPQASAFDVTFDRPVDPATFTPNLVQVFFHDTTASNTTGGPVTVLSVKPLNSVTGSGGTSLGATVFQVNFTASSKVGTYSYSISPGISDRIRSASTAIVPGTPLAPYNSTDTPEQLPSEQTRATATATGSLSAIQIVSGGLGYTSAPTVMISGGGGTGATATAAVVNGSVALITVDSGGSGYTSAPTITLVGGGGTGARATSTLAVSAITVTSPGSLYAVVPPVTFSGGNGSGATATATVTTGSVTAITVNSGGSGYTTVPTVTVGPSGPITSTIPITNAAADQVVSSLTVTVNITEAYDPDLTLTLIAPDGTRVLLAQNVGDSPNFQNFTGTIFDDNAPTSITSGTPPFSSSFRPQQSLGLMKGQSINGNWTLEIVSSGNTSASGVLKGWSLNITPGKVMPTTTSSGNKMDQNGNGTGGEPSADLYSIPTPTSGTTPFIPPFNSNTLPLIVPGPHVIGTAALDASGNPIAQTKGENLALNQAVTGVQVTFDRDMNSTTFSPAQVLSVVGPTGPISGPFTVKPVAGSARKFNVLFPTPQTLNGTYTVTLASSIQSQSGDALDTNENAGVSVLFGTAPLGQSAPATYTNSTAKPLAPGGTITSAVTIPTSTVIQGLTVALDITYPNDPDLEVFLVAPDGTQIELIKNAGATGTANFSGTILDDTAATSIQQGAAPFTGRFLPSTPLSTFNGKNASGTWTLKVKDDNASGPAGTLNSWSLTLLPPATTTYNSPNPPAAIPQPKGTTPQPLDSSITVPDSFLVQGVSVQLDITYPNDPDLEARLIAPDGTAIQLFKNVGTTGTRANFTNTVFADTASTSITQGGSPFYGSYLPQQAGGFLRALVTGHTGGPIMSNALNPSTGKAGVWTLEIINDTGAGRTGTLNSWSLTLTQNVPISGLGEPVADQASASFQISNNDPTNPQSSTSWTPVGPTAIGNGASPNGYAGRVSSIAADPSDASGNTVYAAGASGGVWKTTDFLTADPNGPTWVPLTDFGPTSGLNIGSIAVFGRNGDPNQSIIIAGTGEAEASYGIGGDTTSGVGFLRSMDGGKTWTLLDSKDNTLPYAQRDHTFAPTVSATGQISGTTTYKVVVDPRLTPQGNVIIYAALGGAQGGLWRSVDTGNTWQKLSDDTAEGTTATDVALDLASATVNAVSNPSGNVSTIYVAFQGTGTTGAQVYSSPNQGLTLLPMIGSGFDAFIQDANLFVGNGHKQITVASTPNPVGSGGRVTLAKPGLVPANLPNADIQNTIYEGWLYAAVANSDGTLAGLFVTKDYGATWTLIRLPNVPLSPQLGDAFATINPLITAIPSNDTTQSDYDPLNSNPGTGQGNFNISLAVDPTNPNIVYLGGSSNAQSTGLIRVDITGLYDSHAFVPYDGGGTSNALEINTTGRIQVADNMKLPSVIGAPLGGSPYGGYLNLIQNPADPFTLNGSTVLVFNTSNFTNTGAGARWTSFDELLRANAGDPRYSTNVHQILTMVDPLTGQTRLIVGDDQGVFTGVDNDGTLNLGIGTAPAPTYGRNGNLQIAQLYSGTAQPSTTAAQIAHDLIYGNGLDVGSEGVNSQVLSNGNIQAVGTSTNLTDTFFIPLSGDRQGTTIATDQQGRGIVYQYVWPGFSGSSTNFFQVSVGGAPFIAQTNGLVQVPNDPQWPNTASVPLHAGNVVPGNFTVNPVNGNQVIISSNAGRIFETIDEARNWQVIGDPSALDGSYAPALTFGAPEPSSPVGATGNFIYAGTVNGNIFVTQTGGGSSWTQTSNGLDGSGVMQIIADPVRGSHDAYAVTLKGVYYISDSIPSASNPTPTWVNITGNLFAILQSAFGDPSATAPKISNLTGIQADWDYVIPNTTGSGTHPVLYVSANSGVYRSLDGGQTWSLFPATNDSTLPALPNNGVVVGGGLLPDVEVSSLALVQGNIDPTTGRAAPQSGDANILLATTFGRGQFVIRLAPIVFPGSVQLDTKNPAPTGSVSGKDAQGNPIVKTAQPVINGLSEQTALGNVVTINLVDMTDPAHPKVIGTGQTNTSGNFSVQVNSGAFTTTGIKKIGVYATDQSGTQGNLQTLTINLQASNLGQPVPPAPPTLGLNPADDSSGGLNITNFTNSPSNPTHTLELQGTTDPNVTVNLYKNAVGGTPVATTTSDPSGNFTFTQVGPFLADATYTYVAQATNINGASTPTAFSFTILTHGPTTTPTLGLASSTDTGAIGDGITANLRPSLAGTADPNVYIDISDSPTFDPQATFQLATTTGPPAPGAKLSSYSIQVPGFVTNGTITLFARSRDKANNVGPTSAPFVLTIAAATSAPAAPVLQASSDTGLAGDDTTTARSPAFNVAGVMPGATLHLLRNGVAVAAVAGGGGGGTVALADPGPLVDGRYSYTALQTDAAGNTSPLSGTLTVSIVTVRGDYNGDGKADLAVFRRVNAGEADWFIAGGITPPGGSPAFGSGTLDIPLEGDLDGDGKADRILFRPSTGQWLTQQSSAGFVQYNFGGAGDLPAVGDFDGVGHDELAVYRPSTGQWFVAGHGTVFDTFGGPEDIPVPLRNYYGNGKDELAVYRPSTAQWFVAGQGSGISFGGAGDVPLPLYNFYGDGRDTIAVFRPSTATWYVGGQSSGIGFGGAGDIPIALDYDGIGRDELGVFRPSTGQWFIAGHGSAVATFGGSSDIPLASPYAYRALPGTTGSLDFGINALSLSSGSNSSAASLAAAPPATSASTSASASTSTPVVSSSTQSGRPNQSLTPAKGHLHDFALASLRLIRKRGRGNRLHG